MGADKSITEHPNYENVEAFTIERAEAFCWATQTVSVFGLIKLIHRLRDERDDVDQVAYDQWQQECEAVVDELRKAFPGEEMPVSARHAAQKAAMEIERLRSLVDSGFGSNGRPKGMKPE